MPNPRYNNQFISRELFDFYRQTGRPYEGFVKGEGYAYTQKGAMATSFSTAYNPSNPFCQGSGFYNFCTTQVLDTSPEAIVRSLELTPNDLMSLLVRKEINGSLVINMGNGKLIKLSDPGKSSVNISIHDNGVDLMLDMQIVDKALQQEYNFQCKLRDMPAFFSPDVLRYLTVSNSGQTSLQMPTAANDYRSLQKQNADIDWVGITGKANSLAGFYTGYREGRLVRYRSIFDNSPSEWYAKNKQWRPISKGANQYTGSKKAVLKAAKGYRVAGRAFFYIGIAVSITEGSIAYQEKGWAGVIKPGVDVLMGTLATFGGPIGLGIGITYFVFDAVGFFDRPTIRIKELPHKDPSIFERDKTYVAPRIHLELEQMKLKKHLPMREQPVFRQGSKDPLRRKY